MGKKSRRNRTTTKDERKANRKKTIGNINKKWGNLERTLVLLTEESKYGGHDAWQRTIINQLGTARNAYSSVWASPCEALGLPSDLHRRLSR